MDQIDEIRLGRKATFWGLTGGLFLLGATLYQMGENLPFLMTAFFGALGCWRFGWKGYLTCAAVLGALFFLISGELLLFASILASWLIVTLGVAESASLFTASTEELNRYKEQLKHTEELLEESQVKLMEQRTPPPVEDRHFELLYKQLRGQFEEKSQQLFETRQHLFLMENQLIAYKKEQEIKDSDELPEVKDLIGVLQQLSEEKWALEEHIQELDQLVAELMTPKKTPRMKKSKIKKGEDLPLILQNAIDSA